ncbi:MAG: methylmalonyl-CoA epimerase [Anaerolineae bacterium]|nr:methylmalonyl-CoA epimerase [Anaerolineae bacterium]
MPHKINHVAIVVEDLQAALGFWQGALGLPLEHTADRPDEAVRIAFLPLGEGEIELLQPIDPDSGVAKYIAKRGPGMHHLCIEVDDIDATMARLREHAVELINDAPKTNPDGTRYAFVHPKSAGGVLVELYELPG